MFSKLRDKSEYDKRVLVAKITCTGLVFAWTFLISYLVINASQIHILPAILIAICTAAGLIVGRKMVWEGLVGLYNRI